MAKYSYSFLKPYIKNGKLITKTKEIEILSLSCVNLQLRVLKKFSTIDEKEKEFVMKDDLIVSYLKPSFYQKDLYLARVKSKYAYNDNYPFIYLTDDQINYFMTPMYSKLSSLRLKEECLFEFSQKKKNMIFLNKTYNYDSIYNSYKSDYDKEKFEEEIWNYIRKMFTWCEDEVITAFLPGVIDSLNKFKDLHEKIDISEDISWYDYHRAFDSLTFFLSDTLYTMLKIGEKQEHITTPFEILERHRSVQEQERKLKEEIIEQKRKKSSKLVDEFDNLISARRDLLAQFNKT